MIDLANLSMKLSPTYWSLSGLGYDLTIDSPDWSYGCVIDETGTAHYWGKVIAGQGAFLSATAGFQILAEAGQAAKVANGIKELSFLKVPANSFDKFMVGRTFAGGTEEAQQAWAAYQRAAAREGFSLGTGRANSRRL